jgi:hypothetical protein
LQRRAGDEYIINAMPIIARLDVPEVLHHIMGRGIEKKDIFFSRPGSEWFSFSLRCPRRGKADGSAKNGFRRVGEKGMWGARGEGQ